MSLIESFADDYRRWSRTERIVWQAFLIAALGAQPSPHFLPWYFNGLANTRQQGCRKLFLCHPL